ncbi:SDR family oxidoreductase [Pigmentiphaga soli]|uniref:SDR family oxidoreductase n=2 Tax=Pigmentiphaga soli TaxID=1007095 RepID=A0ABP8H1E9_9BURK
MDRQPTDKQPADTQRVAWVTGAASGIGLASARWLAEAGHAVVLLDRSEAVRDAAASLAAGGAKALAVVVDLADLAGLPGVAAGTAAQFGHCDILVNNAGVHPKRNGMVPALEDIDADEWEAVFRVNVTAPFLLCRHAVGPMKARGWGRIVNVASRAGRAWSDRAGTHYSASKAALIGMTRKIAGDFAAHGITANCVAPGQIETPLARTSRPEVLERAARATPVQRLGTTDEIAAAVAYLASDAAGFVTGTVLDVNGGIFMA